MITMMESMQPTDIHDAVYVFRDERGVGDASKICSSKTIQPMTLTE